MRSCASAGSSTKTSASLTISGRGRTSYMLEMRAVCERCNTTLTDAGDAVICSFECTFCVACGS
ncbi:MAG: DUF1272 domain-containing protein, partial [Actinomycetota bacterium]